MKTTVEPLICQGTGENMTQAALNTGHMMKTFETRIFQGTVETLEHAASNTGHMMKTFENLTQASPNTGQVMVISGTLMAAGTFVIQAVFKAGEEGAKTGAREGSEELLIESAPESAAAGTGNFLVAVAVCSAAIEVMFAAYGIRCAKEDTKRGTISKDDFKKVVKKRIMTGIGSVGGCALGTAIGQLLIPVPGVGGMAGSLLGGLFGRFVGNLIANSWL